MRLKNKRTGEIVDVESLGHADSLKGKFGYQVTLSWKIGEHLDACKTYNSLAELNEDWKDYEEPEDFYIVEQRGTVGSRFRTGAEYEKKFKSIGNYFDTREEAEKAVEKLKALTEAKEDGLKIKGYYYNHEDLVILADIGKCNKPTLDTLFGKEID